MHMATPKTIVFPALFLLCLYQSYAMPNVYNILYLGAKPDGKTDSTNALSKAWSLACNSPKSSFVHVPQGQFLIKQLQFNGPCKNKVTFLFRGTLLAPSDYNAIGNAGNWLHFQGVDGVSIQGGVLDGRGAALWACKRSGGKCPLGATTLEFSKSKNVAITGLTSQNSQMFNIAIINSENVKLQGLTVLADGNSPNTDGIHVQMSTSVTILNSKIGTGDDCVSVGPGATNLWIEGMTCGPGHGISIGSLGRDFAEAGVQNVTVKSVTFTNTQSVTFRIKSWNRPSKGFVKHVLFQHVIMSNAGNPIIIDQDYCPHDKNCPHQASGVQISDVTYQDIRGTSATEVAVKFDCSRTNPCHAIRLVDVNLTYKNKVRSSCTNAAGTTAGIVQPSSCLYRE